MTTTEVIEGLVRALNASGQGPDVASLFHPEVVVERYAPPTEAAPPTEPVQRIEGVAAVVDWLRLTPSGVDFDLAGDILPDEVVQGRYLVRYRYRVTSVDWQNGGTWHFAVSEGGTLLWLAHRPDAPPDA